MANPKLSIILSAKDEMTANIDKAKKSLEGIRNSGMSARQQLRQLQQNMAEMNRIGADTSTVFTETAQYAGALRDAIGDASTAINAYANDQFKLKAGVEAMSLGVSVATTFASSMEMLGIKNEDVAEAIKKTQMALTMLNGVQQVANLLNKDSALMLRIKQIQLKANAANTTLDTAATTGNTAAIGANTVATKIADKARQNLNRTIAIGKAMMGDWTGIVLLAGAALTSYAMFSGGATDEMEDQTKALEKAKSAMQSFKEKVAESAGSAIGKFEALRTQWLSLQTTASKTKWIDDNKSAFSSLGLSITSVTDAENAFVNNTDNVIKALTARARAAAAQEMIADAYKKKWQENENAKTMSAGTMINEDDPLFNKLKNQGYFMQQGIDNNGKAAGMISPEGARWYNATKSVIDESNFSEYIESLENEMISAINEQMSLDTGNLFNGKSTKNTTDSKSKDDKVFDPTSIAYARQQVSRLQKEWEEAYAPDKETIAIQLDKWKEELEKRLKRPIEVPLSITTDATEMLSNLPDNITSIKSSSFDAAEGVTALGNAVNTLGGAMQNLSKDSEGLAKAAAVTQAVGTLVLSFAQSMKGSMTVWDWIAGAVAGVATLTSVVAQLQSFDQGGIVGGSSFYGDRTLVRANAGEMILNRNQQNNLYRAIADNNLGGGRGGNVTFTIKGSDLVGTLNNYNSKNKKQG